MNGLCLTGNRIRMSMALAPLLVFGLIGCPAPEMPMAKMTLVASSQDALPDSADKRGRPPMDDVFKRVIVTVEEILVEHDAASGAEMLNVFTGPVDVDVMRTRDVSHMLATADVPAGAYSGFTLVLSTPRVVFQSQPNVMHSNFMLANDGVFNVPMEFEMKSGRNRTVALDLGGMQFVQGVAGPMLAPEVYAQFSNEPTVAKALGKIRRYREQGNGDSYVMTFGRNRMKVTVDNPVVYLPGDDDVPSGTPQNLVENAWVFVLGTMNSDGSMAGEIVHVLRFPRGQLADDVPELEAEEFTGIVGDTGLFIHDKNAFMLHTSDEDMVVFCDEALVFLPGDGDLPTGSKEDVETGDTVSVMGLRTSSTSVHGELIRILEKAEPEPVFMELSGRVMNVGLMVDGQPAFEVVTDMGTFTVLFNAAELFLFEDVDTPTGMYEDLMNDMEVYVFGELVADGTVGAQTIRVLANPEPRYTGTTSRLSFFSDGNVTFFLNTGDMTFFVLANFDTTVVFLPGDEDEPTGTLSDLRNSMLVTVFGEMQNSTNLIVDRIVIEPPA